uniref:Histidine/lysine/arginine/ornithine transport system permease protein HisM n=1 Tax=Anopheles coluzzii TaxID=1518534 RepID=A0A8W7PBM2_ANOCL
MTLWLLIASVACGFCLSIPLAVARVSSRRWISGPVWFYTYVFRGTPLYIQLLIFYSGVYSLHVVRSVDLLEHFFREGLNCTILAFALNTCAYTTEIFAGAIRAIPYGEIEAARALGMSPWVARDVNAATYASFEAFGIAAVLYACIAFALVGLFRLCENRWLAFLRPMGH